MPYATQSPSIPNMTPVNNGHVQPNQEQYHMHMQIKNSQQLQQLQQSPQQLQQQKHNQAAHSSQLSRKLSTSDKEIDSPHRDNPWQVVKSIKRRKTFSNQNQVRGNLNLNNRYSSLPQDEDMDTNTTRTEENSSKPPPIFIYSVVNLPEMLKIFTT
jgi:hypothetical protein